MQSNECEAGGPKVEAWAEVRRLLVSVAGIDAALLEVQDFTLSARGLRVFYMVRKEPGVHSETVPMEAVEAALLMELCR